MYMTLERTIESIITTGMPKQVCHAVQYTQSLCLNHDLHPRAPIPMNEKIIEVANPKPEAREDAGSLCPAYRVIFYDAPPSCETETQAASHTPLLGVRVNLGR